jgi:hypothetical protein
VSSPWADPRPRRVHCLILEAIVWVGMDDRGELGQSQNCASGEVLAMWWFGDKAEASGLWPSRRCSPTEVDVGELEKGWTDSR